MFFVRPLFVLVVWVFVLAQFKNYLSLKEINMKTSLEIQKLETLISDDENSNFWILEEGIQTDWLLENEQEVIIETNWEQSTESLWDADISSSDVLTTDISKINNNTVSEPKDIQKPLSDSMKSSEQNLDNQITIEENDDSQEVQEDTMIIPESSELDTGTETQESQDSWEPSSAPTVSSTDENDSSETVSSDEWSWDTSPEEDQSTDTTSRSSTMTPSDENDTPEETSWDDSSEEEYYTCENWKIVVEDSIAQRRIIKSYCDNVWGEITNSWGNIKYYLCILPNSEEVWIEYIGEQLCE